MAKPRRQLNIDLPEFDDVVFMPGDDVRIRKEKTLQKMGSARQTMANILRGCKVLLVLDDLWHLSDLDW